jgi:hypothetical protein
MKKILFITVISLGLAVSSCSKGPGEGGKSKITGKIWVENYKLLDHLYDTYELKNEYAGVERDVYLIFGDDISYGMNTKSGPNGEFEFDYLREGDYTVYVESKDTNRFANSATTSMKVSVTLGKKQTNDVGTITIYN